MYEVVGVKDVNFKAQDGSEIKGQKVYVEYEDEDIDGIGTDSFFLSDRKFDKLRVNEKIDIRYNRYGKIERVDKIS